MNKKLEHILKQKEKSDIQIVPNGITYCENLGFFEKKAKRVIITFGRKKEKEND